MAQTEWEATLEEKSRFANSFYVELHNALLASLLAHHGQYALAQLQFQMLRRHHKYFVPGLKKLGLDNEATDAIAAAKYHVLSNQLGGLDVDYIEETGPGGT